VKRLLVGDMHVVPEELDDCNAVIMLIQQICRTEDIKQVWWMGDQHHTHAVLRLEVLAWWKNAIKALKAVGIDSVFLVGNHDQASPGSAIHAMMAYEYTPGVRVIDRPVPFGGVLLLPYFHDEEQFQKACRDHADTTTTVLCHQTFDGSTYENGFLASDGFNPNLPPQELIISGHIHTGQEFGKVWYLGAPRWRSLSDANVERSLWVVEFDHRGKLVNRKPYSTGDACRQIIHREDTPESPVTLPLEGKHQWRIDIKGPPSWCQERKVALKAAGARVRTFPTQVSAASKVRESEGVEKAFRTFLDLYQAKHGTSREVLEAMAKERLSV
jgi:hypothetical protein